MSQYSSSWDECLSCRNMCQGLDYIFYSDDEESEKKEWRLLQNFDKKNNQIWIYITFLSNFWELPTFEESNTEEWKHKEWKLTLLWSRICWIFMPDAGMYFFLKKWLWNWEFSFLPVPLRGTIHPWTDSEYQNIKNCEVKPFNMINILRLLRCTDCEFTRPHRWWGTPSWTWR